MRLTFSFFLIVKNISYNFLRETMLTSIPPHPQGDGESSRHTLKICSNKISECVSRFSYETQKRSYKLKKEAAFA